MVRPLSLGDTGVSWWGRSRAVWTRPVVFRMTAWARVAGEAGQADSGDAGWAGEGVPGLHSRKRGNDSGL